MLKLTLEGDTPLKWIRDNDEDKISAFFGSKDKWASIKGWEDFELIDNPPNEKLEHGYDESKTDKILTIGDIRKAARFRGGKCLSDQMEQGDMKSKLKWECAHGHQFEASPFLILKTGHWCAKCVHAPWNFDEQARKNPFLAQVWYTDHEEEEQNSYI